MNSFKLSEKYCVESFTAGKIGNLEAVVEKIAFNVKELTEAWSKMSEVEDSLRLGEGQKKLGDYVR